MDRDKEAGAAQVVASEEIYRGRVISVSFDTVREAGIVYTREVVHHPGGAGVVAVYDDGTVGLVRQYRHPPRGYVLEIPAGRLEGGERPEECAAREMGEELGVAASRMELLSSFLTTPGFCSERLWVYLATGLTATAQHLEGDEILEVKRVPFESALALVASGEIDDAKTIVGLLLAAPRLGAAGAGLAR